MTWYVLVLVTQMTQGLHEGFLWYNPTFETKQECVTYVNENPVFVLEALETYYPDGWELKNLLCIREDKLESMNLRPFVEGEET